MEVSDAMMFAIAKMPYEMAMKDELSRRQFYANTQRLVAILEAAQAEVERLRDELRDRIGSAIAQQPQQPAGRVHDLAVLLVDELDGLVGESDGVSGLHLNGDVAIWDELLPGGRFERLSSLDELRAALATQPAQAAEIEALEQWRQAVRDMEASTDAVDDARRIERES